MSEAPRWRWLRGWVGPLCLGVAAGVIGIWQQSWWIVAALVIGYLVGSEDPRDYKGRRQ